MSKVGFTLWLAIVAATARYGISNDSPYIAQKIVLEMRGLSWFSKSTKKCYGLYFVRGPVGRKKSAAMSPVKRVCKIEPCCEEESSNYYNSVSDIHLFFPSFFFVSHARSMSGKLNVTLEC